MKTPTLLRRIFIHLPCFLIRSLVDSSPLSSSLNPLPVTCEVGKQAVLPCSWKSRLGEVNLPTCYVQWENPPETVFEKQGERQFEAEAFEGRLEVPKDKLESGNCSLIIHDVQMLDTGRYESFMVVDGVKSTKTRVFIQSVRLSVIDYKSHQTRAPGQDLVLDLHTSQSMRVVFMNRTRSEWAVLWMREDGDNQRFQKHPLREELVMTGLTPADEGTYKVVDKHGLAVNTVQLSVKEGLSLPGTSQRQENRELTGGASKNFSSALLFLSVLVTVFQRKYNL
ncbi:uncharacterized protein LOC110000223 isoform X1 [Xyrichtys novacula]|uniref:Uncharacterized protein LOC110000223 isoform X1 n=1 Tax=Xyrichtys novacula TaxID=13765 RepID=A0AAV1HB89_XYRNO|nr:uncharacterized protein LOC110000223 isoform X1 [Xyrichtys novacula]